MLDWSQTGVADRTAGEAVDALLELRRGVPLATLDGPLRKAALGAGVLLFGA